MNLQSIVSYKDRGKFGDNKYRGNTTGKIIRDLIEFYQPKHISDFMCGGNTTGEVVNEFKGVKYSGYDLNPKYSGFDALNDDIPHSSDFIFWHPPYWDIIKYSGKYDEEGNYQKDWKNRGMWGKPNPNDLSRIRDYEDFIKKIDKIQAKMLRSLKTGGRIAILVGDIKKQGKLYSMQKDMSWFGSPEQVVIKAQHNYQSAGKKYNGKFIPIVHEYLLIFKRDDCYIIPATVTKRINIDLRQTTKLTWRDLVYSSLEKLRGYAELKDLYSEIENHKKTKSNKNWKAKIRQTVQNYEDFNKVNRGKYKLAV